LTWSQPIQVNQTPNTGAPADRQAWNPTVAVAADGTVGVTYYDFRNNTPAPGASTDYWLAYCRPSATAPATNPSNWSEVRLTDTSFDLEQAPTRFNGAYFLGDYEGLATAGNDFVAVWGMPDGTGTSQESIFFRRAADPSPPSATLMQPLATATAAATHSPIVPSSLRLIPSQSPGAMNLLGLAPRDPAWWDSSAEATGPTLIPAAPAQVLDLGLTDIDGGPRRRTHSRTN
jgi:hypothetical protein